jgi:chromosome segregation ATPase
MGTRGDERRRSQRHTRILDRVVSLRRPDPAGADDAATTTQDDPPAEQLSAMQDRLDHLEEALDGLQDAMHRHARELAELRHERQPAEMARSRSADARRRGL